MRVPNLFRLWTRTLHCSVSVANSTYSREGPGDVSDSPPSAPLPEAEHSPPPDTPAASQLSPLLGRELGSGPRLQAGP